MDLLFSFENLTSTPFSYLCVEKGVRITPEAFYDTVKRRNQELFQCAWGASDLRQGMITLGREFISPDEMFPAGGDDLLAEAADHSTEVDLAHYAVVHGAVPRLSPSGLAQHRWLAKEWSSLLGMGPQKPPEPVRTRGRLATTEKLFDGKELAAQVSDMMADAVMRRLAAIGLTADTITKLTTLEGGTLLPPAGEGFQEASTPLRLDDNPTSITTPWLSFTEEPGQSALSNNTVPTQPPRLGKRIVHPAAITEEESVPRPPKRARLIEVDCGQEEPLQVNRRLVPRPSPPASRLLYDTPNDFLMKNILFRDPMKDDLLAGNIRGALQQLLRDPTAREKSKSQMEAILLVMRNQQDGLITMRTGGGKSMLWLIPALLNPDARFIVVCPFTVLLDQQFELAKRHGLQAVKYDHGDIAQGVQILFVQVEHVGCRRFRQ